MSAADKRNGLAVKLNQEPLELNCAYVLLRYISGGNEKRREERSVGTYGEYNNIPKFKIVTKWTTSDPVYVSTLFHGEGKSFCEWNATTAWKTSTGLKAFLTEREIRDAFWISCDFLYSLSFQISRHCLANSPLNYAEICRRRIITVSGD